MENSKCIYNIWNDNNGCLTDYEEETLKLEEELELAQKELDDLQDNRKCLGDYHLSKNIVESGIKMLQEILDKMEEIEELDYEVWSRKNKGD